MRAQNIYSIFGPKAIQNCKFNIRLYNVLENCYIPFYFSFVKKKKKKQHIINTVKCCTINTNLCPKKC